jgi:two-component sensor histidine kinase
VIEELEPSAIAGAAVLDRVDRVGRCFEGAVFPSLPDTFSQAIVGIKTARPHIGSCAAAAYRGKAVTCTDVGQETRFDEEWRKLCLESGIRAIQSAPALAADGTPLGTFVLGFRQPHEFNSFDAELVALGSKLAGLALERHRAQEKHELLVGELRHRIQNVFAVIYSIAHFTFRGSPEVSAIGASFNGRLAALARAHSLAASQPDLAGVIDQVLAPYRDGRLVEISGPPIALSSEATHAFILALHELATNAAKYGALSIDEGCLMIDWCIRRLGADDWFELRWVESNGPLVVPPTKTGFGSTVIERTIAQAIDATSILDYGLKGSAARCAHRSSID